MALIKWEPLRDIEDMFERYSRPLRIYGQWRMESAGRHQWERWGLPDQGRNSRGLQRKREGNYGKGLRFHRVERSYGNFIRSFTLPNNVDSQHLKAHFHDGLLEVDIPKTPETQSSSITVPVD